MSVKNTIWFVGKIIICLALSALLITMAATVFIVFTSYSRIRAVGENMQMELTKNNTLYTASYAINNGTADELVGFSAQLQRIAEQSDGTYEFKGISIINEDGSVNTLLEIIDPETGEFTYEKDLVGAYGDFRTIQLNFVQNTSVMFPQNAAVNTWVEEVFTQDVSFSFVAPCLRYLKDGEVI